VLDGKLQAAVALHGQGQLDRARAIYEEILRAQPRHADALHLLGVIVAATGNPRRAVELIDSAIALVPGYAPMHNNRGVALQELRLWQAALGSYERAAALDPAYADPHFHSGNLLCEQRQWERALASFDRALALNSNHAETYSNRAFALKELARLDEALASCDHAVAINPAFAGGHANRGGVLMAMLRPESALASYDKAIAIDPEYAAAYVNRAMARLLVGDFAGGWADYEWRWRDSGGWIIREKRHYPQPLWSGREPLAGRTLLLHSEQGYGDTLQFCRYAKLLGELGARVILEVPDGLTTLLRSLDGATQIVAQGEALPPFDYYCPLLSLPFALNTSLATVPAVVPYLNPPEEHRHRWRERLRGRRAPRVGLAWSGGFRANIPQLWSGNDRRNIPLAALAALNLPGIEYYSLQKDWHAQSELAEVRGTNWQGSPILDLTGEISDFADTAAFIEQLDLVISVDTAVAHVAGALGKPVWILNRFDTCWRWLLHRSDSPWYPTARLYRQEAPGDWTGVLQRVRRDLADLFAIS
jgi:tetratricopeptide (TPR) repeat protein